ncbi:CLUMA_CG004077, isoform A [Clunio marinus]|uniref:CLUMA_CG004077, isoform A n=1 Tax=Clunio marinus TaxID=568069 RepID=A0A1J1HQL9_9DIPT|nr:CLUMA_CG004077, isoform A [Clunio marinus]
MIFWSYQTPWRGFVSSTLNDNSVKENFLKLTTDIKKAHDLRQLCATPMKTSHSLHLNKRLRLRIIQFPVNVVYLEYQRMDANQISRQSIDACKDYFRDDLLKSDWALMYDSTVTAAAAAAMSLNNVFENKARQQSSAVISEFRL